MIATLALVAAISSSGGRSSYSSSAGRSSYSSAGRTTTGRSYSTSTTSRGYDVPSRSASYRGSSYNYNSSPQYFNNSNWIIWYLLISENTKDMPTDQVREVYEDQLQSLRDSMKKHDKLPNYETSYSNVTRAFRGHSISNEEIGATLYNIYAKHGPAPKKRLPNE